MPKKAMDEAENILKQIGDLLQTESNEKIKKAMQLFVRVDDFYKRVVLHGTGFSGELTAKNLRDHFDTIDLLDGLDDLIWNLNYELEENT